MSSSKAANNKKRAAEGPPEASAPAPAKKQSQVSLTEMHEEGKTWSETCNAAWTGADAKFSYLSYAHVWMGTSDMDATCKFYLRVLGFKLLCRYGDDWAEFRGPGGLTLGVGPNMGYDGDKSGLCLAFDVADVERAAAGLRAHGVEVAKETQRNGPVLLKSFKDPNGYECVLAQDAPPEDGDAAMPAEGAAEESKGGEEKKPTPPYPNDLGLGLNDFANVQFDVASISDTLEFFVGKLGCKEEVRMDDFWAEVQLPGGMHLGFLGVGKEAGKAQTHTGFAIGIGSNSLAKTRAALMDNGVQASGTSSFGQAGPMKTFNFADVNGIPIMAVAKTDALDDLTVPHPAFGGSKAMAAYMKPYEHDPALHLHSWCGLSLRTADLDRLAKFYIHTLDWQLAARREGMVRVMGPGGVCAEFTTLKEGEKATPSSATMVVGVVDFETSIAALKKRGVTTFQEGVVDKGMVLLKNFTDPDGNDLALIGMKAPPQKQKQAAKEQDCGKKEEEEKKAGGDGDKADGSLMFKPWPHSATSIGYNSYGNITLPCRNLDETEEFYTSKLGGKKFMRHLNEWMEIRLPGRVHIGFGPLDDKAFATAIAKNGFELAVGTSDMDATVAELKKRGVNVPNAVQDLGFAKTLAIKDNSGNTLKVWSF